VEKNPCVYMMANRRNGAIYTGVTSNLPKRVYEHRNGLGAGGFSDRYGCQLLVWYEMHAGMEAAILREKQIKAGSRRRKLLLIEAANPLWVDLYDGLF